MRANYQFVICRKTDIILCLSSDTAAMGILLDDTKENSYRLRFNSTTVWRIK